MYIVTVCLIFMRFYFYLFFFCMPDLYLYEIFKEQTVCMCVLGVFDRTLYSGHFPPKYVLCLSPLD